MYVISSAAPDSGYTAETRLALPDDKWAIDGTPSSPSTVNAGSSGRAGPATPTSSRTSTSRE